MGNLKYKGYTGSVEYSENDDCLFGKVIGMNKDCITYEGQTIAELKRDFEEAIDSYLGTCKSRGITPRKPFSGSLNIRISPEIHDRVALIARQTGTSINTVIKTALEKQLKEVL